MTKPIVLMARNRLLVFIYEANLPFLPLYLGVTCVFYPLYWGSWGLRPELWRIAGGITQPTINTHHTLIIWGLGLLFLVLWRVVKLNPMLALGACFIVLAWHEIDWWVVDWIRLGSAFNPVWLLGGYLYPVAMITTIFWFRLVGVPWRYMLAMAGGYVVWFAIGFPVTVNWTGRTPLYDDAFANWVEIASWVYGISAFYVLERDRLKAWQRAAAESISLDRMVNHV